MLYVMFCYFDSLIRKSVENRLADLLLNLSRLFLVLTLTLTSLQLSLIESNIKDYMARHNSFMM